MSDIGIYVLIPFCNARCSYCDFVSSVGGDDVKKAYFTRLISEIHSSRKTGYTDGRTVTSVYFGGGTPSCVRAGYIAETMDALRGEFVFSNDCEITLEANPESFTRDKAAVYADCGINRISLGLQSASDELLRAIGRIHTLSDFLRAADISMEIFSNVSADIMLALPGQTANDAEKAVRLLADRGFDHISAYSLKVEDGTPLQKSGYMPDEDFAADLYAFVRKLLCESGYRGYEVSNFALPGKECRHNMRYWMRGEYIGFGAAAHSFFADERFCNTSDIAAYIAGTGYCERRFIAPGGNEAAEETVMLALRTAHGLDVDAFDKKFRRNILREKENVINRLKSGGMLNVADGRLTLTEKGLYVMNEIILRLVF